MDVELYDCVVTHYGYRQAEVVNRIAKFDFNTGDHIDQLRDVLAYEADSGHDNHEVFVATKPDGSKICFQFSDWKCYVGTDIRMN